MLTLRSINRSVICFYTQCQWRRWRRESAGERDWYGADVCYSGSCFVCLTWRATMQCLLASSSRSWSVLSVVMSRTGRPCCARWNDGNQSIDCCLTSSLSCVLNRNNAVMQSALKAVVSCQNKIILKNFRPEPPPSVDRPKIILFQHGNTSKIILTNFILTWNHVWNEVE